MVIRLSKLICLLSVVLLFISCKNDAQKRTTDIQKIEEPSQKNNFFDKKYFHGYLMSVDESTPAEHPFYSYLDCKKEGYFSVHFIPKEGKLVSFWKNRYFQENKYEYDDLKTENRIISKLLDEKYDLYNIFCFQIAPKYLDLSNGCTEESINLKNDAVADIFLYNSDTKQWDFQKSIKVDILPPFADNNFFSNNFPSIKLPSNENIKENNDSIIAKELESINDEDDLGALIFTKNDGKLFIREDILDYISKNTTASQNKYEILLQKYVTHQIIKFYDENKRQWTKEQLIKIIAYASNTTDPLHKKYWKQSPENWHNGMWGYILGFCYVVYPKTLWIELQTQLKKENYYNLPYIKEMISYALEFDRFGPP